MFADTTNKKYLSTICKRNNIELTQNIVNKTYNLTFFVNTKTKSIKEIFTFDFLFNLLNSLDKSHDFIESTHIIKKTNENDYDLLFIFKHLGANLGVLKKYLCFNLKKSNDTNNNTLFNAVNIKYEDNKIKNLDKVILHFADMTIVEDKNNSNNAIVNILFNLEIDSELPKIVNNFVKLVMRNMVINLKQYIDTL